MRQSGDALRARGPPAALLPGGDRTGATIRGDDTVGHVPGLYAARCEQAGGASWLQVSTAKGPADSRPTVSATLGPAWGYHLEDVNLALGNLVADVAEEEAGHR